MCQAGLEKTKDTYGCNERGREVSRCEDAEDESEMEADNWLRLKGTAQTNTQKTGFFFFFFTGKCKLLLST